MNMFHLPVAAAAVGFLLGCGGFIFIELGSYKLKYLLVYDIPIGYYIWGRWENQLL
jgi:hypothetical protein